MSLTPIRKTLRVALPPDAAFDLFTRGIGRWWPNRAVHRLTLDPRLGGDLTERGPGGVARVRGRVTGFAPGRRLVLDWSEDGAATTRVQVDFLPDAIGTRVILTHSGFDALAPRARARRMALRDPRRPMLARAGRQLDRAA